MDGVLSQEEINALLSDPGAGGIHLLTRNRFEDAALIVRESGLLKELNVEN